MNTRAVLANEVWRNTHPLMVKDYPQVRTWKQWREIWDKAKTSNELAGLLHYGLDVEYGTGETWYERLEFYLSVADGFNELESYFKPLYESIYLVRDRNYLRAVATKAMQQICLKALKEQYTQSSIIEYIVTRNKLIDFFSEHDCSNTATPDRRSLTKPYRDILTEFLPTFLVHAWAKTTDPEYSKKVFRLIIHTNNLFILEEDARDETIRLLENEVLKQKDFRPEDSPPSIGKILLRGRGNQKEIARLLLALKEMRAERERIRKLMEATQEKEKV